MLLYPDIQHKVTDIATVMDNVKILWDLESSTAQILNKRLITLTRSFDFLRSKKTYLLILTKRAKLAINRLNSGETIVPM